MWLTATSKLNRSARIITEQKIGVTRVRPDKVMRELVPTMTEIQLATYRSSNTCMSSKGNIKLQHAEMTTLDVDPVAAWPWPWTRKLNV